MELGAQRLGLQAGCVFIKLSTGFADIKKEGVVTIVVHTSGTKMVQSNSALWLGKGSQLESVVFKGQIIT